MAFNGEGSWSFYNHFVRNVVICSVDNSSSSHTNNKKNNFLVSGEGPTDVISDRPGAAKKSHLVLTLVKQKQKSA